MNDLNFVLLFLGYWILLISGVICAFGSGYLLKGWKYTFKAIISLLFPVVLAHIIVTTWDNFWIIVDIYAIWLALILVFVIIGLFGQKEKNAINMKNSD